MDAVQLCPRPTNHLVILKVEAGLLKNPSTTELGAGYMPEIIFIVDLLLMKMTIS